MARGNAGQIRPAQKRLFYEHRSAGYSIAASAKAAGIAYNSGRKLAQGFAGGGAEARAEREAAKLPTPVGRVLCAEAQAALEDDSNDLFSLRYFGHVQTPWQSEASRQLIEAFRSGDREFIVMNEPPGAGKSTLLVRVACRLICEDRSVRILFGSRTHSLAARNTARVRRALDRTNPAKAKPEEVELGVAVDAIACLAMEFGRFKPESGGDIWRRDEFVVVQADGTPIDEKEPTVSAYGIEGDELGNRFEVIFWDDLDSQASLRTLEAVTTQREIYDSEAETRLEPRGLLALVQQRLAPHDMSAHCLSKTIAPDEDDDLDESVPQYRHIVYKAHYPDRCKGRETHGKNAPAYPEGCLLDPVRLPYRDLRNVMTKPTWPTVYQQENHDPSEVLVQPLWISGGSSVDTGELFPGCWDPERGMFERPDTDFPLFSVLSTDPSGSAQWGNTWWAIDLEHGFRYLVAMKRRRMAAADILEYDPLTRAYTGLLVDWHAKGVEIGIPFTHWVVEKNAAARWIYRYRFYQQWCSEHGVQIVEHNTDVNKHSAERGVEQSLPPIYRHGLVRLPGRGSARAEVMQLHDEVTTYVPGAGRRRTLTDLLMSQWFVEFRLDDIKPIRRSQNVEVPTRPSWMLRSA